MNLGNGSGLTLSGMVKFDTLIGEKKQTMMREGIDNGHPLLNPGGFQSAAVWMITRPPSLSCCFPMEITALPDMLNWIRNQWVLVLPLGYEVRRMPVVIALAAGWTSFEGEHAEFVSGQFSRFRRRLLKSETLVLHVPCVP